MAITRYLIVTIQRIHITLWSPLSCTKVTISNTCSLPAVMLHSGLEPIDAEQSG